MKVTFLGVGSAFSRTQSNSNLLVEAKNATISLDFGRTATSSLEEYGMSLKELTHIIITHLHADHIGGLEEVAFVSRLVHKHRIQLLTTESMLTKLWNHSLRGGLEFIEETPNDHTPQVLQDFFATVAIPSEQWVPIAGTNIQVYLHPTDHVRGMESYAIEMRQGSSERRENRFFFSGDTKFNPSMITTATQRCKYVFHDCQLLDSGEKNIYGVHASYNQLKQLPPAVMQDVWLYHYGDDAQPNVQKDGFAGLLRHLQSFLLE